MQFFSASEPVVSSGDDRLLANSLWIEIQSMNPSSVIYIYINVQCLIHLNVSGNTWRWVGSLLKE